MMRRKRWSGAAFCFFFFQAEDGIRDSSVTGVRRVLFRSHLQRSRDAEIGWVAGDGVAGNPSNLSIPRTLKMSMARRISLKRPKLSELEALRESLEEARARGDEDETERLAREVERIERRSKIIPYIDPIHFRSRRVDR